MKRFILSLLVALLTSAMLHAQQIAVVSGSGSTSVYDTLDDAIAGASSGSTIYLPGGGFQVSAETKIKKKITIMGISHKYNSENADGNTTISGDLQFAPGSDGSAVMGVYLGNNILIGVDGRVRNILVKYCNLNEIQVKTDSCPGIIVNQTYGRGNLWFGNSNAQVTNCIANGIGNVRGGIIRYNIFCGASYNPYRYDYYSYKDIYNSTISNNIARYGIYYHSGNIEEENMGGDFSAAIVNNQGVNPKSDFHFTEEYEGSRNVGIYAGGTGFSDACLPPMPIITSMHVAEQTDAQGKLQIQVSVKAAQ